MQEDRSNADALHFGSYIHKIFEDGVQSKSLGELQRIAEDLRPSYDFNKSYTPKIEKCLKNFLKFNSSLSKTIGTETQFEINLDSTLKITGVIDRVIQGKNGDILIIDYKTSRKEKSKFELYQDDQLTMYTLAASRLYNKPVNKIIVGHYYPLTNNLVTVKLTNAQVSSFVRQIKADAWKIRKMRNNEFKTSRNEFCNWCSFQNRCPEFNDPITVKRIIEEEIKNKDKK